MTKTELFTIDPSNFSGLLEIMKTHGNSKFPFVGKNENQESVIISVNPTNIVVDTYQDNGWIRHNTYFDDGVSEETFEKEVKLEKQRICPRCGKAYTGHPALSRTDNTTEICPACGIEEALDDYFKNREKDTKIEVREFNSTDWSAFAGAERFDSGQEPLIVEFTCVQDDVEMALIADKTGVTLSMIDNQDITQELHLPAEQDQWGHAKAYDMLRALAGMYWMGSSASVIMHFEDMMAKEDTDE